MKIDGNIGGGPDGSRGGDFAEVVEQAGAAQRCGLDGVWSTEVSRNPFLPLLVAAQAAPDLTVGTAIAVAFATNPMSMASLANDLQSYTKGRFILGLGSQIRPHIERRFSMPWGAPADRMSEFIQALRAIWRSWEHGSPLKFEGRFYQHTLMTPMFTPPSHPWSAPAVLVAAVGDRMTEVAARHADGVILHSFTTAGFLRGVTLPNIDRTLAASGRSPADFTISYPGLVATGDSDAELAAAIAAVRTQVAFYGATPAYRHVLEYHGWHGLHEDLRRLSLLGEWDEMSELVHDEILDHFAVVGPPEAAGKEIARRFGSVVDRFTLATPYAIGWEQRSRLAASLRDAVRVDTSQPVN